MGPDAPCKPPKTRKKPVLIVPEATRSHRLRILVIAGAFLSLFACATPPTDPAARAEYDETNDPLEPMNRAIFSFNDFLDTILIKPVAQAYRFTIPQPGRNMIRHFLDNLNEPVIFADDVMQLDFHRANITAGRFLANTTFGIGGLFDIASSGPPSGRLEEQTGDFGQTLYHYGVPSGPYLVLPILGPSNPRDAVGMGVDTEMDPFSWLAFHFGHNGANWYRFAAEGIDERSRHIEDLDSLKKNSIDFYAQLRSLTRQHRAAELNNGMAPPVKGLDSLDNHPDAKTSESAAPTSTQ
jgi:phospholipid-binding lipoprotein MlaA